MRCTRAGDTRARRLMLVTKLFTEALVRRARGLEIRACERYMRKNARKRIPLCVVCLRCCVSCSKMSKMAKWAFFVVLKLTRGYAHTFSCDSCLKWIWFTLISNMFASLTACAFLFGKVHLIEVSLHAILLRGALLFYFWYRKISLLTLEIYSQKILLRSITQVFQLMSDYSIKTLTNFKFTLMRQKLHYLQPN